MLLGTVREWCACSECPANSFATHSHPWTGEERCGSWYAGHSDEIRWLEWAATLEGQWHKILNVSLPPLSGKVHAFESFVHRSWACACSECPPNSFATHLHSWTGGERCGSWFAGHSDEIRWLEWAATLPGQKHKIFHDYLPPLSGKVQAFRMLFRTVHEGCCCSECTANSFATHSFL